MGHYIIIISRFTTGSFLLFDLASDLPSLLLRRRRDGRNRDHCIVNIVSLPYGHILIVALLLLSISFLYKKKHYCWFIDIALDQIIIIIQYAYYTVYQKLFQKKYAWLPTYLNK